MIGSLAENLKYISQYNPMLCNRILDVQEYTKSYQIAQNENGEFNLLINNVPVHSTESAANEALKIFENLSHNSPNSIHFIYGLGLGYLYDTFAEKSKGPIIIFEPNIELLRFVLEAVDLTENFRKTRTFIVTNPAEFQVVFQSIFRYKTKLSMSVLNYHLQYENAIFNYVKEEIHKIFGIISHNYHFQVNQSFNFLNHVVKSFKIKADAQLLTDYENALKDKPAIVVSAGPSLARNIETLKKYKDNAIIFCVGTALKTLLKNDITPDFLNIIEKTNTKIHFDVQETKDMMLVSEVFSNETVFAPKYKKTFVTASEETGAARWFLEKIGKPLKPFETKGTVAYHALYTAKFLGCNPIILIGQDLAYSDGNCYAKGSAFEDLKCIFDDKTQKYTIQPINREKFRDAYYHSDNCSDETKDKWLTKAIERFNKELVTVDGQNGEKLPTSAVYSLFIEYLQDFANRHNDKIKLINSSIGGAQINGYDLVPFEETFNKYANSKLNKEKLFETFNTKNFNDNKQIIENLKTDQNYLQSLLNEFENGEQLAEKLKRELELSKAYSTKAEKIVTKLSNKYVMITNHYTNTSALFGMICMKERCELDYLMKEFDGTMTVAKANEFSTAFLNYFLEIKNKMHYVIKYIGINIEKLEQEQ